MRNLKFLMSLLLLVPAFAQADHHRGYAEVEGEVYKQVGDDIHRFRAELRVPEMGVGPMILKLHDIRHSKRMTLESIRYFYKEEAGRKVVYIVFPYKTYEQIAVMKGTYMRGENRVTFIGDAFMAPRSMMEDNEALDNHLMTGGCGHIASFSFEERIH